MIWLRVRSDVSASDPDVGEVSCDALFLDALVGKDERVGGGSRWQQERWKGTSVFGLGGSASF